MKRLTKSTLGVNLVYTKGNVMTYKNDGGSKINAYERSFLKVIQGSGLRLFKGTSTFSQWGPLKINPSNQIVANPCN